VTLSRPTLYVFITLSALNITQPKRVLAVPPKNDYVHRRASWITRIGINGHRGFSGTARIGCAKCNTVQPHGR
jgi:hypothetical protein